MVTAARQAELGLIEQLGPALHTLGQMTGLEGRVVAVEPRTGQGQADAVIDVQLEGGKHRYLVEAKTRVDRPAMLGHIKTQLDLLGPRGLLFTPYITPEIARHCRALEIPFLDTAGNAYLNAPGLYVFITGQKPHDLIATGIRGGGTATALRVVFVLLCKPALLNATYREIAEAAGVALGTVGWALHDLVHRGYITGGATNQKRRFVHLTRPLEEWVTNYPIKLRPRLNTQRFRATNPNWWKEADLPVRQAYWGGEVAADRLTGYLRPETQTIYLEPHQRKDTLTKLVTTHRLRADYNGNIEVLDAFWNFPPDPQRPDVVPPLLAYADLTATLDPRNLEAAKLVREQYIDRALHQT